MTWIPFETDGDGNELDNVLTVFDSRPVQWEDAVAIVLDIEKVLDPLGAHTALTGSCLYKGKSRKDVDIVIYPHDANNPPEKMDLLSALRANLVLEPVNKKGYWHYDTTREYVDKEVSIIFIQGIRIDLFFLLKLE